MTDGSFCQLATALKIGTLNVNCGLIELTFPPFMTDVFFKLRKNGCCVTGIQAFTYTQRRISSFRGKKCSSKSRRSTKITEWRKETSVTQVRHSAHIKSVQDAVGVNCPARF